MQQTTFHSANQADGLGQLPLPYAWLSTFYSEASPKKNDSLELLQIISKQVSTEKLEKKIQYKFQDKKFLLQSLMQSTFCYEMNLALTSSNERMEFLGDSLVNFIVGKNLYGRFLDTAEGDLSKLRGALVNEEKLAELARVIELGENLFLGKGEFKSGGSQKDSILADAFEALFAAIYFDSHQNMELLENIFNHIVALYEEKKRLDFYALQLIDIFDTKSKLQELTMAKYGTHPVYKANELPGHAGFNVEIWLGERKLLEMSGTSKKKVEKLLAKKIIEENLF